MLYRSCSNCVCSLAMAGSRFKCDKCDFTTDRTFNLSRHKERHHENSKYSRSVNCGYTCSMCGQKGMSKTEMHHHYTSDHGIAVVRESLQLENMPEFLSWKADLEKKTTSKFSKITGTRKCKSVGRRLEYYQCHRNGVYKSRGSGKRKMKSQCSNKINGFCPAAITATYDPLGSVNVTYIPTHVGHQNDISRVNLTMEQKKMLAQKIESNVPFDQILGDVRGSLCEENIERIHLLKRKDLYNIKKTFNLSGSATEHANNFVSVDSWVKDNMNTGVVRFYKPRGVLSSSYPNLSSDDFLLVVANDAQLDLLGQYGQDCVCLYGSHSIDNCDFELASLLVLDELHQAFPCALMFSKKSDANSLSVFISVLRNILNSPVAPNVIMTDMSDDYGKAWNAVMVPAAHELYSDQQVVQAWKENLRKVKGEKKRKETLMVLQNLLREKDRNIFSNLLCTTLAQFDADQDTSEFGKYFRSEFLGNVRSWAYCYRAHIGFDNNMKTENLHQVLKYINRDCKRVKRLDIAIHSIMNFIRDKLCKRIASSNESVQSTSVAIMKNRHQKAVEMTDDVLIQKIGSGWVFSKSPTSPRKYEIVRTDLDCNCGSKCEQCGACVHLFRCSCHDSAIRWNVCKHIHFIAMNCQQEGDSATRIAAAETAHLATAAVPQDEAATGDRFFDIFDIENPEVPHRVKITVQSNEPNASMEIEESKRRLIASFKEIVESDIKTMEHVRICEKAISSVRPTIEADRSLLSAFVPEGSTLWLED